MDKYYKKVRDRLNKIFLFLDHFSFFVAAIGIITFISFFSTEAEANVVELLDQVFIYVLALHTIYDLFNIFYSKDYLESLKEFLAEILVLGLYIWVRYLSFEPLEALKSFYHHFSLVLRLLIYTFYILSNWKKVGRFIRKVKLNAAQTFTLGFIFLILFGFWLLSLPFATLKPISFLDRFFISTSAVCVTGLVTVDVSATFTIWGKCFILFLIQIGGLGIMSFSTFLVLVAGSRMSFSDRVASMQMFNQQNFQELKRLLKVIVFATFGIELLGALFIFGLTPDMNMGTASKIFFSVFHSISAFCNAGFSTLPDSLVSFYNHFSMNFIIMFLIIAGGLGFPVMLDIKERIVNRKRMSLYSKIVLSITVFLIVFGTVMFLIDEYNLVLKTFSLPDKILSSLFQSVTTRTAGFNTVDMSALSQSGYLWMIFLMFIGASPGSTGGGLKTTTFFILLLAIYLFYKRRKSTVIFKRKIRIETFLKAGSLFFLRVMIVLIAVIVLVYYEDFNLTQILFEVVSAFSTVGLTTGITPSLSALGKIVIIFLMIIGRIGPINMLLSISNSYPKESLEYAEEKIIVG